MRKPIVAAAAAISLLIAGCGTKTAPAPASTSSTDPKAPASASADPAKANGQTPAQQPPQAEPPKPAPAPEPPKPVKREMPKEVRGILVSGWYAGSPDLVWPLLKWAKSAGINTIVLDIKAEDGKLSWESDIPLAKEIGANVRKVGDLPKFIQDVHDMGFWVAGRIVTFNDTSLSKAHPDWGIPGSQVNGYVFLDPKNENVWQYNIDIAKAAVKAGVDEIQFDYIRYPEKLVSGYNKDTGADFRTGNIDNFLKKAYSELKPLGVTVGADLFGLTTSVAEGDDMQIGQDYKKVAEIVDYVAAMAYPSHYAPGTYGLDDPNRHPYETIKNSMGKALERTQGMPIEKHRPWIQDFTLGGVHYGSAEVWAQVKALHELGINQFMIWDPSCKFSRDNDYSKTPS